MLNVSRGRAYWCAALVCSAMAVVSATPALAGGHSGGQGRHAVRHRETARAPRARGARYATYADTAAPRLKDAPLPPKGFRFWQGPTVPSGDVPGAAACGVTGSCYVWPLRVAGGGWRLRVALDTPLRSNTFELDVVDPTGHAT